MKYKLPHKQRSTLSLRKYQRIKNELEKKSNNNATCLREGALGVMRLLLEQQVPLTKLSQTNRCSSDVNTRWRLLRIIVITLWLQNTSLSSRVILPSRDGRARSTKKHYRDSEDGFNIALRCGYDLTKLEEMERHIYVFQNLQESTLVLQVLQTIFPNNVFFYSILSHKKLPFFTGPRVRIEIFA